MSTKSSLYIGIKNEIIVPEEIQSILIQADQKRSNDIAVYFIFDSVKFSDTEGETGTLMKFFKQLEDDNYGIIEIYGSSGITEWGNPYELMMHIDITVDIEESVII